jgi:hypothetical protein
MQEAVRSAITPPDGASTLGVRRPRTERAHRTSPDDRRQARHIGTYVVVALDAQIAG